MIYLLDTNAISDLMNEHPAFRTRISSLAATDRLMTCVIVRGEVEFGIQRLAPGKRRSDLERRAQLIWSSMRCLAVPPRAASNYAGTKLARARKGVSLDENDLWIVATAMSIGATLVSRDSDLANVVGIQTEDWSKP